MSGPAPRAPRRPWRPEEEALLRTAYPGENTASLAQLLGRPARQVLDKANALGLRKLPELRAAEARANNLKPGSGCQRTHFKPGGVAWNKGLKGFMPGGESVRTRFKAGHQSANWRPVGSHRINADGYLERKVSDEPGDHVRRWQAVHRLVWIAAHGPIPPGHLVRFKPGRRSAVLAEITLDALEMVSRVEQIRDHNLSNLPADLQSLVRLRGQLVKQIRREAKKAGEGLEP